MKMHLLTTSVLGAVAALLTPGCEYRDVVLGLGNQQDHHGGGSDAGTTAPADATVACPAIGCLQQCPNGYETSPNGCPSCTCKPINEPTPPNTCGPVCGIFCQYGNVKDSNGCDTCACLPPPPPTCGPVCGIFCQYGQLEDANGCRLCECAPAPGTAPVWGGEGILIEPNGSSATVVFNCAAGTISGALPGDGTAILAGTYAVVGGAPVPPGGVPTPADQSTAEYTISVRADFMEVTVRLLTSNQQIGPLALTRGSKGHLEICP
jgi:hypothetical protein